MKHVLAIVGFILVTFSVQGLSHFVINKEHFESIPFTRESPIMPLGFAVMIIQGAILSLTYSRLCSSRNCIKTAYQIVLAFGLFLGSYIALTEPAKYTAPSVTSWILIESTASFLQFAIFGVVLWFSHYITKRFFLRKDLTGASQNE